MTATQHQVFGKTGLTIPKVVFGSTCLGNLFVSMSGDEKRELIREWFANMPKPIAIDSAGKYGAGLALEVLGKELALLGVKPHEVVISNKLAWRRVPLKTTEPTFEPGVWKDLQYDAVQDISYDGIKRCYEDGCRMLGDYQAQLISVHDPDEYLAAAINPSDRTRRIQDIQDAYRALYELRDKGLAAGVGIGAKDWRIIRELDQYCDFDWVMMANSFTIMQHPPELVDFVESLASRNIPIINSAVLHGGFLLGSEFCDYRRIDTANSQDMKKLEFRKRFQEFCRQFDLSPFAVAVRFGLSHPAFSAVALSTSDPKRVHEMVSSVEYEVPAKFWDTLRDAGLIDASYAYV